LFVFFNQLLTHYIVPLSHSLVVRLWLRSLPTLDGPGAFNFVQGTTSADPNRKWNALFHLLKRPTLAQTRCQHPKPIALLIGDIDLLGGSPWAATVIPLQMFRIGQLVLVGVPGEFTTMSGRRLRDQVQRTLVESGVADENTRVVIAGLSNEYIHYCATPEEYAIQRYEAASTLFGPEQLPAFLQEFTRLSKALATGSAVDTLPAPKSTFNVGVVFAPRFPPRVCWCGI
jgi:neutral ceramidase